MQYLLLLLLLIVGGGATADAVVLRDVLKWRRRGRFARGIAVQNVVVGSGAVVKKYLRRRRTGRRAADPVRVPMAAAGRDVLVLIEIGMVMLVLLLVVVRRFGRLVRDERLRRGAHVVDVTVVTRGCRGRLLLHVVHNTVVMLLQLKLLLLLLQVHAVMMLELGILHQELYRFIRQEETTYNHVITMMIF